jgi:succinyl-CoA synthetase alpha subunit
MEEAGIRVAPTPSDLGSTMYELLKDKGMLDQVLIKK